MLQGREMHRWYLPLAVCLLIASGGASAAPPKMSIFHFDVNTGDSTLVVSPDGHGVLIDAGDRGRGKNPIAEFLNRAKDDGVLESLDFTVATHYDADHIGGMDEVYRSGWYPGIAAYDRGDSLLPPFDSDYVADSCSDLDADVAEAIVPWGEPSDFCPADRHATCQIIDYFIEAEAGGRRRTAEPGQVIELDHGIELLVVAVNAEDAAGNHVEVDFPGRRDDCAANDLSIAILLTYGDFRYLVAGDLTGVPEEDVADVEGLIADDLDPLDVYHINHHGAETSSNEVFLNAARPTVAIVSNGRKHDHPRATVIERILTLDPPPAIYLTNKNTTPKAWDAPSEAIADSDYYEYDGMIEISVWRKSYRVFRWREGGRLGGGDRFDILERP